MKIFILCEIYPSNEYLYALAFVHPRVKEYVKRGFDVTVISFSAKENYKFDGVKVQTKGEGKKTLKMSGKSVIMSHAPNLRNHIVFLIQMLKYIQHIVFFFHGHEILNTNLYYPFPYDFDKKSIRRWKILLFYNRFKLFSMKRMLIFFNSQRKTDLVFVSNWMYSAFYKSLKYTQNQVSKFTTHVINSPVSEFIVQCGYEKEKVHKADFITIRPLNVSKYAIDLIVEFAINNPEYTFHIYGRGDYFKHNIQPPNITVIDSFINQKNIPDLLNYYKYAIMPTRIDAQGVMMCEMAYYGIPTITSDLLVCREMLEEFENVKFISNNQFNKAYSVGELPNVRNSFINKFGIDMIVNQELALLDLNFANEL